MQIIREKGRGRSFEVKALHKRRIPSTHQPPLSMPRLKKVIKAGSNAFSDSWCHAQRDMGAFSIQKRRRETNKVLFCL